MARAAASAASHAGGMPKKRRRTRKTRTAVVESSSSLSSSSSSSSSEEADSSDDEQVKKTVPQPSDAMDIDSSSDSTSSSSSSSESSREEEEDDIDEVNAEVGTSINAGRAKTGGRVRTAAYSPPPEIPTEYSDDEEAERFSGVTLRSKCRAFYPPATQLRSKLIDDAAQRRQEAIKKKNERMAGLLAERRQIAPPSEEREQEFQSLWMRMIVDEFGEELDALRRKEPSLNSDLAGSRMPLLVDALQSGSELFSRDSKSSAGQSGSGTREHQIDEVGLLLWKKKDRAA